MKQKIYRFEDFVLDQKNRQLFFGGKRIALTSKNFEILSLLVENSLEIVEKQEIFEAVWGGSFVEENNLPVRISNLRNLFKKCGYADEVIKTISGRGYIFTMQAQELPENQAGTRNTAFPKNLTQNSEAKDLCFKGQYILDTASTRSKHEKDFSQAEEFFNAAIRADPNCAEAYIGKAYCQYYLYCFSFLSKQESGAKCRILLQQAQLANPHSAEIFFMDGLISLVFELNSPKAIRSLLKAIEFDPSNAQAYLFLGRSHLVFGHFETAYEYFMKAGEINPSIIKFRTAAIRIFYYSQDFNRAITACKDILAMDSRAYAALYFLCLSYAGLGIYDEATKYCDELIQAFDSFESRLVRAYILALKNQHRDADLIIAEALPDKRRFRESLFFVVLIYTAQNKIDEVFELLSEHCEEAHYDILLIKVEPGLRILHDDKRFQTVLEKLFLV